MRFSHKADEITEVEQEEMENKWNKILDVLSPAERELWLKQIRLFKKSMLMDYNNWSGEKQVEKKEIKKREEAKMQAILNNPIFEKEVEGFKEEISF